MIAELTYPELFLDLTVEPASAARKMVGGGVLVGDREWDRDHYVLARDEAQSSQVLRRLLPALAGARLRRLGDHELVVELRDAGQSRARLKRFARGAVALARLMETTRQELPPPSGMHEVLEDWRALARTLGAPLETARMRVEGQLGAHPVEVRLAFDAEGRPLHTWLSVRPAAPFDASQCVTWSVASESAVDFVARQFRGSLGELATIVCDGAREVSIEPERMMVCLPAPLGLAHRDAGDGERIPVVSAERRLERMAQLTTLLRGNAGPYR